MAQTYKMMLGTSGKQWEQLTVKDDGTMMLYFHGTNQSVTQEVTVITEGEWKGWLRSEKGSMWPGLESGKWNNMDDGRCKMEEVRGKMDDGRGKTEEVRGLTADVVETPRPRRQRKPRVERQPSAISHQPSDIDRQPSAISHQTSDIDCQPSDIDRQSSDISHQTSDTMKAIGMVAAATVALFVIYETGLLIPLGLIGLATGGILK